MIIIKCDICLKEPTDRDFSFEAVLFEIKTQLTGADMIPMEEKHKKSIFICKGCYYTHISKLLKNAKS